MASAREAKARGQQQLIDKLKVGPFRMDVVEDSELLGEILFGQVKYDKGIVQLAPGMCEQQQLLTLWHEVIHIILTSCGIPGQEHSEHLVDCIAHGVVQVIQDNEELVALTAYQDTPSKKVLANLEKKLKVMVEQGRAREHLNPTAVPVSHNGAAEVLLST